MKKYFENENVSCEVTHYYKTRKEVKIDINQIIGKNKALISVFAGSRKSEILVLMPILLDFIKLMNEKYTDMTYVFHSTREYLDLIQSFINESSLSNCEIVSDDKIKNHILHKSVFAVAKSGTVSFGDLKCKRYLQLFFIRWVL